MVTADVEEPTQLIVLTADDHHWLTAWKLTRGIVTGRTQLIETGDILPASSEDGAELELQHAWIGVPGRRDREGALERRVRVVEVEDLLEPFQIRSPPSDYAIRGGRHRLVIHGGARPSD